MLDTFCIQAVASAPVAASFDVRKVFPEKIDRLNRMEGISLSINREAKV